MNEHKLSCWIITGGRKGNEILCRGIAMALGASAVLRPVSLRAPWLWLAPWGPPGPPGAGALRDAGGQPFAPPWPDLLLVSGRRAIPHAHAVTRAARGKTFSVYLHHPHTPLRWFDLIWAPEHDRLAGDNVVSTLTSPHVLTNAGLAAAARAIAPDIARLPHPRVAVLLGGPSRACRMDADEIALLARHLRDLAASGAGLMITASRRTPAALPARLRRDLDGYAHILDDGTGKTNPYQGFLGAADAIIVTGDSINMTGEASFTGKPVHVFHLPSSSARLARFHTAMTARCVTRPFHGTIEDWRYPPLDANPVIADRIMRRLRS